VDAALAALMPEYQRRARITALITVCERWNCDPDVSEHSNTSSQKFLRRFGAMTASRQTITEKFSHNRSRVSDGEFGFEIP
jgi:hypothetical protein